ncbi:MAG TPA: DUF2779 domain-containing protein [Polyangia bacterium]|nr:DUF2779 domain-containing protein [Polyangia bacterium]
MSGNHHARTHVLSKSTYMRGMQCEKALWLYRHRPELAGEVSDAQQAIFDRGTDVGKLAQGLFPGGVDLSPEYVGGIPRFGRSIERTREAVRSGAPVIYEAAFVHDGVLAAMDILVQAGDRFRVYEVKSGTSVKDTYAKDAALQHWVLRGAGLDLVDISVVHIDNTYVRQGDIDVHRLFAVKSVLEHAQARYEEIGREVARLMAVVSREAAPEIPIGPHCSEPYDCSFTGHCWKGFPEHSVFDLSRMGKLAWILVERGITRAADIPDDIDLSDKQRIEVRAAATGEPHVDHEKVRAFLKQTEGPLHFLDFETVMSAVPLFDGTKPYQALPFQYSLHFRAERGAPLSHEAFLGDGRNDPRAALVEKLLHDTRAEGHIVVYSSYEKRILNELAVAFPDRAAELKERNRRLLDLCVPFREHALYTADMNGSFSIKKVLPALVPDLSYDGLPIAEGQAASAAYESLHTELDLVKITEIRKALLDYCGLDTMAMVRLLEAMEGV